MNTSLVPADSAQPQAEAGKARGLDRLARRLVLSRLEKLELGQITVHDDENRYTFGTPSDEFPLAAELTVFSPNFYRDIAFGGSIGAGEAFVNRAWDCDDLTSLLRILLRNRAVLERMDSGLSALGLPLQKLLHKLNRNTHGGSRRNIAAHYDLGNDFYRLWLDEKMMYSCAYFESTDTSLDDASTAKLERICRKLDLQAGDSVLEIGCGWGGMAMHIAKNYGCQVTTTTISRQQYEFAQQAIRDAGLENRITLLRKDYRDLDGRFDKIISVEMVEAVGHEYHDTFFRKCCELLKSDGQMLLQAITIADQRYDQYRKSVDFINRYIFPGGCLTSVSEMTATMTSGTDLRVIHLEDIGPHYATTLRHWQERFLARIDEVRALGFADEFIRMWRFYLCYCESAFVERAIGDVQMLIMRPDARPKSQEPAQA